MLNCFIYLVQWFTHTVSAVEWEVPPGHVAVFVRFIIEAIITNKEYIFSFLISFGLFSPNIIFSLKCNFPMHSRHTSVVPHECLALRNKDFCLVLTPVRTDDSPDRGDKPLLESTVTINSLSVVGVHTNSVFDNKSIKYLCMLTYRLLNSVLHITLMKYRWCKSDEKLIVSHVWHWHIFSSAESARVVFNSTVQDVGAWLFKSHHFCLNCNHLDVDMSSYCHILESDGYLGLKFCESSLLALLMDVFSHPCEHWTTAFPLIHVMCLTRSHRSFW